jgi:nucleoid-associated protein YgaU/peptidoglycan/xylan/chitin deacetylase (PgdA/CDA1 family)
MEQLWQQIRQVLDRILSAIAGGRSSTAGHATSIPRYYVVQPGDTLWGIARRFDTTIQDLVEANNIQDPNLIIVGQRLIIPTGQEPTPTPEPQPTPTPEPPPPAEEYFEYIVQPGDTLWHLSRRFNTTIQKLVEINHIQDPSLIVVGQTLLIPKTSEPTPTPSPTPTPTPTPEPIPPPAGSIKAVYVTYWAARHAGLRSHAFQLLEETELNAVVIDIKGEDGLLYNTFTRPTITDAETAEVLATAESADHESVDLSWGESVTVPSDYNEIRDFETMMAWLRARGYYIIARIVVFKDNRLVAERPDLAVKDGRTGQPWRDYNEIGWADPFLPEVWEYNAAIAAAAAQQGFNEIQYDYVRFPTDGPTEYAQYAQENTPENRQSALNELLILTRQKLRESSARLAVDFFGYTCWRNYDTGIGQVIESVAPHIDVLCPMLYPSTFGAGLPGFPQYRNAIAFPYEVVNLSTVRAVERLKKVNPEAVVRPWIQDFPDYRFDKRTYTPEEIQEEMRGAIEGGSEGWMLWDPRVKYTRDALGPVQEPIPPTPVPEIPVYPPNKMGDILVLEFHNIDEPEGRWTRSPDNFRRDLEYLLAQGYYPVNLIDVVRKNLDHVPRGRRPVVLTFDDSSGGQFRYLEDGSIDPNCAVGIMNAMHEEHDEDWPRRATFFVLLNADEPGLPLFRQDDTGPQKVRTLVEWGMEIGSHTIHHLDLSQATPEQIRWELAVSQNCLEALIPGRQVRSFAVPYGAYPDDLSLLQGGYSESEDLNYRYEAAVKIGAQPAPSPFGPNFDPFHIPRVQAFQAELDKWFPYYERYPERCYVSDGGQVDTQVISPDSTVPPLPTHRTLDQRNGGNEMTGFRVASDPPPRLLDPNGVPFFAVGVNCEGYFDRAWRMWDEEWFDLALIEKDFRKARQVGFNTLRLFVQSSLEREITAGNFDKLDWVLELAARHQLYVLLALNDDHSSNLSATGQINAAIAEHYRDHPAILGYDLENEPKLYHLLVAQYPDAYPAPVHSTALIEHYGERVSRAEVEKLRQQRRIPGFLDDDKAYYYANALQLFLEFDAAFNEWHRGAGQTLVDYIASPDSSDWQHYIQVIDGTVAAWIAAQRNPIRAAAPNALITVGWDWLHFAALPANRVLDVHQFHVYGSRNLGGLRALIETLEGLQRHFLDMPILVGEYGYSNASSSDPATSQPVPQSITALYEGALLAYLRANGFAGGLKWMLNDATGIDNPFEANLGVFAPGDQPKEVAHVIKHYTDLWSLVGETGDFTLREDTIADLGYRYSMPGVSALGGGRYQDLAMDWRSGQGTHLYLAWADNITVEALSGGELSLNPAEILPDWADHASILHHLDDQGNRVRMAVVPAGEPVRWTVQPERTYVITKGARKPEPLPAGEIPQPGPGEHVLILPDAQAHLDAARAYIARFLPDVNFRPEEAVGRWPYVTIVGDTSGVTTAHESMLREAGAWVERVAGGTLSETQALFDRLVAEGRRFLKGAPEEPPEPPPPPPPPPPPEPEPITYTVQPGDTLWLISVKVYGTGSLWRVIFEANQDILSDPGRIRPGQVLKIPPRP